VQELTCTFAPYALHTLQRVHRIRTERVRAFLQSERGVLCKRRRSRRFPIAIRRERASNTALSVPGERLVAMSDAMWAVPHVVMDGQEVVPQ
jgi:hypothetical protein